MDKSTTQAVGFLAISFSARGSVAPSGSHAIPIVFMEWQIDGQACQPDVNAAALLYRQLCS
jgi:hypothetical protein